MHIYYSQQNKMQSTWLQVILNPLSEEIKYRKLENLVPNKRTCLGARFPRTYLGEKLPSFLPLLLKVLHTACMS